MATLTFNYADSTAVIGPLPPSRTPHSYDLCVDHARSFTVPNGWTITHLPGEIRESDDVLALARALAEPSEPSDRATAHNRPHPASQPRSADQGAAAGRHLRVVRSADDD